MIRNNRTTMRTVLGAAFLTGINLMAQTPTVSWKAIAPGFTASFNTPFVNDAGQAAYGNKTNGFSLGTVGTPVQRTLQTFIASAGLGLDVAYCVAGENGRVGYLLENGLVDDAPGAQKILAARNGPVPGLPAGAKFAPLTFQNGDGTPRYFAMSPSGVFVLPSVFTGTGIVVSGGKDINDQAVMRGPATDFKAIARAGDAAPGLVDGYVFAGQATRRFDAVVNRSGVTAIRARAVHWNPPSPFPLQNAEGIWLHDPTGGLRLAVTAVSQGANPLGDTAPGTDGARFTDITLGPAINDDGNIAFAARTFNFAGKPPSRSGIWSGPASDLQPVHLFGAPVPGLPGVTFDNPFNNATIKLGSGRTVCFSTVLAGTGVTGANNIGVFVGSSLADVRLLARIGTQAPGLAAGVTFAAIPGDGVVVFGTNRVALRALITGPGVSPGVDDKGLWITDDLGKLQLLARIGDSIATDIGAVTMAGDFVLHDGTGQDGLASSGNRSDQLGILDNGFVNASYAYLVTVGTPVAPAPKLAFSAMPNSLTLTWPAGYKLQSNAVLAVTGWVGIPFPSPFVLKGTAPQAFFRLVQ